jgi:hypothetical protein
MAAGKQGHFRNVGGNCMAFTCSQCGAKFIKGENCDDRFSLILAKEFEIPDYGAVHHMSVPCYYLQHNLYSKDGWLAVSQLLKQFASGELTPEMARRDIRANFDGANKPFSMTKGEKLKAVDKIKWSMTIADVRLTTAETYCFDIQKWAESIIKDTEQIIV